MSHSISRAIRKNIFDGLTLDEVSWSGKLDDVDFLSRLYDLEDLPSTDSRYKTASGDIYQHRVNNWDWENDWVFTDKRFSLLTCSDENFLAFLAETIHPVVRPDLDEARKLAEHYNDQLKAAGWELVEAERIAGRPRFEAKPLSSSGKRSIARGREVSKALDAGWMAQEIARLERSIDDDPALAIGTAKDLTETCCKSILKELGIEFAKSASLQELSKAVLKELKLVPEGISEQAKGAESIRLLLRNLGAISHYLAEVRGLYGSGHGRDGKHRGLEARHARLAVGAAVVFIDFVTETYRKRGQ